jgi:hypothetical protein
VKAAIPLAADMRPFCNLSVNAIPITAIFRLRYPDASKVCAENFNQTIRYALELFVQAPMSQQILFQGIDSLDQFHPAPGPCFLDLKFYNPSAQDLQFRQQFLANYIFVLHETSPVRHCVVTNL